jgi:hypothetical protein
MAFAVVAFAQAEIFDRGGRRRLSCQRRGALWAPAGVRFADLFFAIYSPRRWRVTKTRYRRVAPSLTRHRFGLGRLNVWMTAKFYDNAHPESFFKTCGTRKCICRTETFDDVSHPTTSAFYREVDNKKRLHSALGYLSPRSTR